MRIFAPLPTIPVPGITTTPAARPLMRFCTSGMGAVATTCAALILPTEFPSARCCSPPAVPVTMTWFSSTGRSASANRTSRAPTGTLCVTER